jgi:hypothetical protein
MKIRSTVNSTKIFCSTHLITSLFGNLGRKGNMRFLTNAEEGIRRQIKGTRLEVPARALIE